MNEANAGLKLKCCPFCGCDSMDSDTVALHPDPDDSLFHVWCHECRACGPIAHTWNKAGKSWNTRPGLDKAAQLIRQFKNVVIWLNEAPIDETTLDAWKCKTLSEIDAVLTAI